ncbi:MAG: hypothetical protein KAJ75_01570 [Alphaproteobacteria bacterium]|nr:hypothetical protein [Alphaproteobacteria bacterium]
MKNRVLFLIIMTAVFAVSGEAFARHACPLLDTKTKAKIITNYGNVQYFHDRSRKDIKTFANKGYKVNKSNGTRTLAMPSRKGNIQHIPGITVATLKIGVKTETKTVRIKNGKGFCIYLDNATVSIGYPKMEVYVAKRYKKNSCEYNEILNHEKTHVSIYHNTLNFYAPHIEQSVKNIAKEIKPTWVSSKDKIEPTINNMLIYIMNKIEPTLNFFRKIQTNEHANLDTPENYAYTTSLCKNW